VLSEAVREEAIAANPASRVRAPSVEPSPRRFLSADELESIAAAVEPRYGALVLLLGYSGLRFGEAATLRVKDLDLLRRRVSVTKALREVRGEAMEGPPKTRSAVRSVAIPERVSAELASHVDAFAAGPDGRSFTSPEGGPLRNGNFRRRVWIPAVAAAGVEPPAPRVHDLRHTAASLAIQGGAHPKAVQELLGHASIGVTFDVYGHLFPSLADDVAARVDELARAAAESVASRAHHDHGQNVGQLYGLVP
jgi:integrase